jgi:osmotically-inducible protein OsmY
LGFTRPGERRIDPESILEQNNIVVLVADGIVTLQGMVEDGAAIEDAIRQAYDAGAKDVISKLQTDGKFTRLNQRG